MASKFGFGDKVHMPGVPFVVVALEFAPCDDDGCDEMTFRFKDPGGMGDDWAHVSEFERVEQPPSPRGTWGGLDPAAADELAEAIDCNCPAHLRPSPP